MVTTMTTIAVGYRRFEQLQWGFLKRFWQMIERQLIWHFAWMLCWFHLSFSISTVYSVCHSLGSFPIASLTIQHEFYQKVHVAFCHCYFVTPSLFLHLIWVSKVWKPFVCKRSFCVRRVRDKTRAWSGFWANDWVGSHISRSQNEINPLKFGWRWQKPFSCTAKTLFELRHEWW